MFNALLAYKEDGGNLAQFGQFDLFPVGNAVGVYVLLRGGDAGCNAEAGLGSQGAQESVEHLAVAVGGFYEELGLTFVPCPCLERLELLGSIGIIDGKIPIEGKALAIQSATHDSHNHAAGSHQRNYLEPLTLGNGYHIGTGIGNSWTAGFAYDAHRDSVAKGLQILTEEALVGMLSHLVKSAVVDGKNRVHLTQEAPGGPYILYDEVTDTLNDDTVAGGQNLVDRGVTQCDGNEIECGLHVGDRLLYIALEELNLTIGNDGDAGCAGRHYS